MDMTSQYIMENPDENRRLEIKTDPEAVRRQASLCGIGPGMRVLDAGCGVGKTTSILSDMIQPGGIIVGVDFADSRIRYAEQNYGTGHGITFRLMDLREPLGELGLFDCIWVRFVLEHYLEGAVDIIKNLRQCLKPGGILCLLDLDYNCLSHYPMKTEMEAMLQKLVQKMIAKFNFDPYVGRKLYTYLYDLGFHDIRIDIIPHHLIYGELGSSDEFNWIKKVEMASVKAKDLFKDYPGGYEAFFADFDAFFHDPRRFTYTPLMVCRGKRPVGEAVSDTDTSSYME